MAAEQSVRVGEDDPRSGCCRLDQRLDRPAGRFPPRPCQLEGAGGGVSLGVRAEILGKVFGVSQQGPVFGEETAVASSRRGLETLVCLP